jgi:hypothetical protein
VELVLKAARSRHPELANMVNTVLNAIEENRLRTAEGYQQERTNHLALAPNNISAESLKGFLNKYAPLQLLVDRQKSSPIRLSRKLLTTADALRMASTLVLKAGGVPGDLSNVESLAKKIVVDKKTARPHPLWTTRHDAILVQAVLKHGWIANDQNVRWGAPFEISTKAYGTDAMNASHLNIDSAVRAASFLNEYHDIFSDVKGLSIDRLVRTYCLELVPRELSEHSEGGPIVVKAWVANVSAIKVLNDKSSSLKAAELPPKRDLVRRARAVLSRSSSPCSDSVQPTVLESTKAINSEESYGYALLDQDRPCNVLLSELLRSIAKTPSSFPFAKLLWEVACSEAEKLLETAEAEEKSDLGSSDVAKRMKRIVQQLLLAKRTMSKSTTLSKNVILVVLGETPKQARGSNEGMFPVEKVKAVALPTVKHTATGITEGKTTGKRKAASQLDSATTDVKSSGELAIENATKRCVERLPAFSVGSDKSFLELTEIETSLLLVICSHGFPVWNHNWQALVMPDAAVPGACTTMYSLNWKYLCDLLVKSLQRFLTKARKKVAHAKKVLESMPDDQNGRDAKVTSLALHHNACREYEKIDVAHEQAIQYASDLEGLAKKAVMMMARVLKHMGPMSGASFTSKSDLGVGMKVLRWLDQEIFRWARALRILDENNVLPLAYTAVDFLVHLHEDMRSTVEVVSVFDKSECRAVAAQVAMLCRLRSIFELYQGDDLTTRLWNAVKKCETVDGMVYENLPQWWGSISEDVNLPTESIQHDNLLLVRLLKSGFYKVLENTQTFGNIDMVITIAWVSLPLRANLF